MPFIWGYCVVVSCAFMWLMVILCKPLNGSLFCYIFFILQNGTTTPAPTSSISFFFIHPWRWLSFRLLCNLKQPFQLILNIEVFYILRTCSVLWWGWVCGVEGWGLTCFQSESDQTGDLTKHLTQVPVLSCCCPTVMMKTTQHPDLGISLSNVPSSSWI